MVTKSWLPPPLRGVVKLEIATKMTICTKKIGTRKISTRKNGTRKNGTRNMGTKKMGARKMGARKMGAMMIGARKIGAKVVPISLQEKEQEKKAPKTCFLFILLLLLSIGVEDRHQRNDQRFDDPHFGGLHKASFLKSVSDLQIEP